MKSNRQLSLAEVVSIEAWYDKFNETCQESEFFLHVKFQDGVFGSDPAMPVRFRIRLKHAKVIIIPEEPITVPRRSVSRNRLTVEATHTIEKTNSVEGHFEGAGEIALSATSVTADARAKASVKANSKTVEKTERKVVTHSGMHIEHDVDDYKNNRWSFSPISGEHLLGQAFHETKPIMKVAHKAEVAKIRPSVKVRVTCLREHIDILDLKPKEEKKGVFKKGIGETQKLALAEQIIKKTLGETGLEFEGDLDAFSQVVVAEAFATEE